MLHRVLPRFEGLAYALLRIFAGAMFAFHGAQKLFGVLVEAPMPPLGVQLTIGGVIELVGGLLVAVGLLTRWAAFLCSGTMAVAYVQFHWKGQLDAGFFPAVNGGEPALLYAFVFLLVACRGPGTPSVDAALGRRAAR